MVKKFFRPFICAACAAMSVICGTVPMVSVYADAETVATEAGVESETPAETQVETQSETQPESVAETEPQSETESESESKTESESQTESETETETETESESEKQTESETESNIGSAIELKMKQDIDMVAPVDEFKQEVSVSYKDAVDSKITYNVDPLLDVKRIEVGSNTYLEGGKAVITCSDGEKEVSVTATMDLSGYKDITKIVFIPKISSYSGMEAKFTAVLKLKDEAAGKDTSDATCKTVVNVTKGQDTADFESSLTTTFRTASVGKPSLSLTYDGKEYKENGTDAIEFDKEFALNLSSISMTTYGKSGSLFYTVATPTFVTVKEIAVPDLSGVSKVKVTAMINNKEESLGEAAPGSKIDVGKNKVSEVKFEIVPDGNEIATKNAGSIVFANDNKKNKKPIMQPLLLI